MTEISGSLGARLEERNLITDARKLQRHYLLRTYTADGAIEPTCFKASCTIDALIDNIETAQAHIAELREALEIAATQFEYYAGNHRAKRTYDGNIKAMTNEKLTKRCRQALAKTEAGRGDE